MARVKLEGIRKTYESGEAVVHGIDLEVRDGEFVVLVGPSGCGKSTTLRMIAGLEAISGGTLMIGDRVVNDLPPKERDIAMVFQSYALYPHMSVRENMAFALKLRKLPAADIERRVREAAAILGLEPLLDRKPRHLSGGQRQRVAIGRAIVRQPQVFLFDEPLSNLDAKLRVQTRREIAKLHRQLGVTVVYVTHDQVEAMTLGERIVVLDKGRVQQIDTPLGLYDHPRNKFVAGFIGSPAMNFFDAAVTRDGGSVRVQALDGALSFAPDASRARSLESHVGKTLTGGIRPEDIYPRGQMRSAGAATATARLQLDVVEPLGSEILLYARTAAHDVTARVAPQPLPQPGQGIELEFDLAKMHFFDAESELAIGGGDEGAVLRAK